LPANLLLLLYEELIFSKKESGCGACTEGTRLSLQCFLVFMEGILAFFTFRGLALKREKK